MFVWNKISTQSYSAKFLYWGDHVNSVPDLTASAPRPAQLKQFFQMFTKTQQGNNLSLLKGV